MNSLRSDIKVKKALTLTLLRTVSWILTKGETPASWKEAIASIIATVRDGKIN